MSDMHEGHGVGASGLLHASRGFLLCFWGAALGLLMLTGALRFRVLEDAPVPVHLPGCLLALAGVGFLRRRDTGPLRASAHLWVPAGLTLYFAPFVLWWRDVPYSGYLLANAMAAAAAALWMLAGICREAARTGRVLGAASFAREARWGAIGCGVMAGSMLAALALWTAFRAVADGTSLYAAWFEVLFHLPASAAAFAVLPFTVSMACAWRARSVCMGALRSAPPGDATPSA
jgi:hypothetical protein